MNDYLLVFVLFVAVIMGSFAATWVSYPIEDWVRRKLQR